MFSSVIYLVSTLLCISPYPKSIYKPALRNRIYREVTNEPADLWIIGWTGCGDLTDYMVSNTIQGGGPFVRPPDWDYYDGSFPTWSWDVYPDLRGLGCEYPAGSEQYYCYSAGLWVGALYPIISADDTVWVPNVSKGVYHSDLGAMRVLEMQDVGILGDISGLGLYFSDQRIPEGYPNDGCFLFVQTSMYPESYRGLWPFADTSLNSRRPPEMQLDPADGDIVSMQDTYGVAGDWIPADSAVVIWDRDTGPYDGLGLGIRVEQRTYSWNMPDNGCYFFINYKIRNMNDFPLRNLYTGFFMDNDIGSGIDELDQGAWDDLVDYNTDLSLGYTYDYDNYEPDWTTLAGYIGVVLCETPGNAGLTGFRPWLYSDPVDYDGNDSLKYNVLSDSIFMSWQIPHDVRQLSSSGSYQVLEPEEEVDFTIAVVVGYTLDELEEHAQMAIDQFNNGYILESPIVLNIETIPTQVSPGDSVTIRAFVFDPDGISEVKAYIVSIEDSLYDSLYLFDDGVHNDSLSEDHIYGNSWQTPYEGNSWWINIQATDNLSNTTIIENGTSFTTLGPVSISDWQIIGDDSIPSQGDFLYIQVELWNEGPFPLNGITASIITGDHYISDIDSNQQSYGDIEPFGYAVSQGHYKILVSEICPDGHLVNFYLEIHDSFQVEWRDTLSIKIYDDVGPFVHYPDVIPRYLEPGENVIIRMQLIDGSGVFSANFVIENPVGNPLTTITLNPVDSSFYQNIWTTPVNEEEFYNINITAEDSIGNVKEYINLMEFTTKPFVRNANILVVDDDNYNRPPIGNPKFYETYYTDALSNNGYNCDVYDVFCYGSPDTSILNRYDIIVWETGTTCGNLSYQQEYYNSSSISQQEDTILYLYITRHRGNLFLSSQGIYDIRYGNLIRFLGVIPWGINFDIDIDTIIGIIDDPIGNELEFNISGGSGASNQICQSSFDEYYPHSESIFIYQDDGCAGVRGEIANSRTVTLPFGFESINNEIVRDTLMNRIINWILYGEGVDGENENIKLSLQCYPNPFSSKIHINYQIPGNKRSRTSVKVYDITGRLKKNLFEGFREPRNYMIGWDMSEDELCAGIYFIRLENKESNLTRKVIAIK